MLSDRMLMFNRSYMTFMYSYGINYTISWSSPLEIWVLNLFPYKALLVKIGIDNRQWLKYDDKTCENIVYELATILLDLGVLNRCVEMQNGRGVMRFKTWRDVEKYQAVIWQDVSPYPNLITHGKSVITAPSDGNIKNIQLCLENV